MFLWIHSSHNNILSQSRNHCFYDHSLLSLQSTLILMYPIHRFFYSGHLYCFWRLNSNVCIFLKMRYHENLTFSMFKCYNRVPGTSINPENVKNKKPTFLFLISLSLQTCENSLLHTNPANPFIFQLCTFTNITDCFCNLCVFLTNLRVFDSLSTTRHERLSHAVCTLRKREYRKFKLIWLMHVFSVMDIIIKTRHDNQNQTDI